MIRWTILKQHLICAETRTYYKTDMDKMYYIDVMNVKETDKKLWMSQFKD